MAKFDFSKSIEACAARYGEEADAVRTYMNDGLEAALNLPNRGPIKFNEDGSLNILIQHEPATPESNWLPAPPGPFSLTMRLYLPGEGFLSGDWKIPGVVRQD